MPPKVVRAPFLNRWSLARVLFLMANTMADTERLSRMAIKTPGRRHVSLKRKPGPSGRKLLFRRLIWSHARRLRYPNRHRVRGPSRHSDARKLQSFPATGSGGFTITEPSNWNPSLLSEEHISEDTMEVERRSSVRKVLDSQPGSSSHGLSDICEVPIPNRDYRTEEGNEDQLVTNRYAFAAPFVGHIIATYTTY